MPPEPGERARALESAKALLEELIANYQPASYPSGEALQTAYDHDVERIVYALREQEAQTWRKAKQAHKEYKELRRAVLRGSHIVPQPFGDYCEDRAKECEAHAQAGETIKRSCPHCLYEKE